MGHHQTKNTVAATKFCNACNKVTLHSVSGKRIGHCLAHGAEERPVKQTVERERELKLF